MIHKNTGSMNAHENKIIERILMDDVDEDENEQELAFSFEVCIDIGDGRKGVIKVDQKSDPLLCALQFCHDYCLDEVIAGILCQSIKEKIDNQRRNMHKSGSVEKRSRVNRSAACQAQQDSSMQALQDSSILNRLGNSVKMQRSQTGQHNRTASRSSKQNTEGEDFSYKPKINEISKIITEKLQKRSIVEDVELNRRRKELKVQRLKKELEQKQISQCSFKPRINMISEKVDSEIKKESSGGKRYEQLYRNSFVIQRNKEHQRNKSCENMTFKPEINRNSKNLVNGLTFEQRQQRFKHNKHDSTTPNPVPKTGRGPRNRNPSGVPIGEYLYEKSKAKKDKIPIRTEVPDRKIAALSKSQDIVCHLKQARLRQIFQQLDLNRDGRIRYEKIYSEVLEPQILEIFLPILEEMRQLDIQLDRSEFIEAADRLLSSLSPQERNIVLNTRKRPDMPEPCPFRPQINKKSVSSAQYTQDLYTRGLQDKKKLKDKLEREKEEHARIEFNQCTFKPKIIKYTNTLYSTLN